MNFEFSQEFKRELKYLAKRWRTLESDLERAKSAIESLYIEVENVDLAVYRTAFFDSKKAAIIKSSEEGVEVVKMRLDTDAPGSKDKVRLVFVAVRKESSITFIELYSKNDKDREDSSRISRYT